MRSYKTARYIFNFLEFLAWLGVAVGVLMLIVGLLIGGASFDLLAGVGLYIGTVPGLLMIIASLLVVMFIQVSRASVNTSETAGLLLANSNEELRLLRARFGDNTAIADAASPSGLAGQASSEEPLSAPPETAIKPQQSAPAPEPVAETDGQRLADGPAPPQLAASSDEPSPLPAAATRSAD